MKSTNHNLKNPNLSHNLDRTPLTVGEVWLPSLIALVPAILSSLALLGGFFFLIFRDEFLNGPALFAYSANVVIHLFAALPVNIWLFMRGVRGNEAFIVRFLAFGFVLSLVYIFVMVTSGFQGAYMQESIAFFGPGAGHVVGGLMAVTWVCFLAATAAFIMRNVTVLCIRFLRARSFTR